jgi:hypothetical protein
MPGARAGAAFLNHWKRRLAGNRIRCGIRQKKFLAIVGARLPVAAGLRFSSSHQDHPSFTGHVGAGEVERERA